MAEVSHDVLAAIIGAIALVMVPTIGFLIANRRTLKDTRAQVERVNLVALRERVDLAIAEQRDAARVFSQAHERRAAEHEQVIERLEDIAEMLSALRNGKEPR